MTDKKEVGLFEDWLKRIVEHPLEAEKRRFIWEVMRSPFVEFHYSLLKDNSLDEQFRRDLMHRFNEHGEKAETLLLSKLDNGEDKDFQADMIFLLGKMSKKHKATTLAYARKFAESKNIYERDRAIIVLGWIGTMEDTHIFENHLLQDTDMHCRAWSASSFMQLWFKEESEMLKQKAFRVYKIALAAEKDYFVLSVILSAIREMGKTKLGISQTALDELDTEKIDASKVKALRFLDKALKS
ncbi:HEAT repeat domain-containing protein [Chitinophaga qingshengii]|uniref:HEAT repeat domain-containing protein n=1 Tax=Chitinophaga qingshengii TaxID=1569794 RepID=A0ABR7THI0_9BACT|nr:HEAT repeat domain-containing protein [Chitinophaga qingshengii]MBC9929430.1 HEAT repeat domain-containing protein [Chitinophaga qingshengii]